jgi:hypothetical protein
MASPADVKLYDPHEFDRRFIEHTTRCQTYEQAYLQTEKDFKKVFGRNKYSGYNSFRVARSRRTKQYNHC